MVTNTYCTPPRNCAPKKPKRDPYPIKEKAPDAVALCGVTRALPTDPPPDPTDKDATFRRYYPFVRMIARRAIGREYMRDQTMGADDLTQEIILTALRRYASYDPAKGKFTTWLIWISRSVIGNFSTASKRTKRAGARPVDAGGARAMLRMADPDAPAPDDSLDWWEFVGRVVPDERERRALELRACGGMNYSEIGRRMGYDRARATAFVEGARLKLHSARRDVLHAMGRA